jgi:AcrR family transcriptional regulator
VLEAALELLVERGYRRTTMAAIAERATASKETLYAWFGD